MSAVHNSLISCRSCDWSNSAVNEAPALLKCSTFRMNGSRESCRIKPHEIQWLKQVMESLKTSSTIYERRCHMLLCMEEIKRIVHKHTSRNIAVSSGCALPNCATRSDHLFGYDGHLNIINRASIPVAVVPWLHTYFSGSCNALPRRARSSFWNSWCSNTGLLGSYSIHNL